MQDIVVISANDALKEKLLQLRDNYFPGCSVISAADYDKLFLPGGKTVDLLIIELAPSDDEILLTEAVGNKLLSAHGNLLLLSKEAEALAKMLPAHKMHKTSIISLPIREHTLGPHINTLLENSRLHKKDRMTSEEAEITTSELNAKQNQALTERIKELNCLYQCYRLIDLPGISLAQLARELVNIIPASWQYPESTCARISIGEEQYFSKNFSNTEWMQQSPIVVGGQPVGSIEVCYLGQHPTLDEGPFMKEERTLLDTLAGIVGHFIERRHTEQDLLNSRQLLINAQQLAHMGDFTWHIESGKVRWSKAMYHLLGYAVDEAINFDEVNKNIHHPDDAKWVNQWLKECILSNNTNFEPRTYRLIKKDGSTMHVQTNITVKRAHGKAIELFGTVQDITQLKQLEWQQQASNQLQQSIVDSSPIPIFSVDMEGTVLSWNKAAEMNFGWTTEEAVGRFLPIIPADKKEEYMQNRLKVIETGGYTGLELLRQTKDGELLEVSLNTAPIRDQKGKITGIMATMEVITQRKAAERNLLASEERLRTTLHSIGDAVITTDIEGRIERMNPVAEQLTAWSEKKALGQALNKIFNIVNALTGEQVENPVKKVLDSGKVVGLANHTKLLARNGKEYQIADSGAPIFDAKGKISGVVLVFRDVSNEYKMQEELIESEQGFRFMFENNPHPMWIYDLETLSFLAVNNAALQLYAYSAEEFSQMTILDIRPEKDRKRLAEDLKHAQQGYQISGAWQHIRKDGSLIEVEISSHSLTFNKRKARHVLIHDITEKQLQEKALEANEQRFRSIVEGAPDPIFILQKEKFSYLNPSACHFFGIANQKQLTGTRLENTIHSNQRTEVSKWLEQPASSLDDGKLDAIQFIRPDGKLVWAEISGEPIEYEGQQSMLVFLRDVTLRIQSENALRASEQRWQYALESAGDGLWDWNLKTNEIFFSEHWKSMLGYAPYEIRDHFSEWEERIHPDDLPMVLNAIQKYLKEFSTYEPLAIPLFQIEHRIRCKNKQYKWIVVRGKVIESDKHQNPLRFIGTHTDITERKLTEIQLKTTQFGIDHAQIGIYQIEEDGSIIYANHYAAQSLGYTREELLHLSLFDITPAFDKKTFSDHRVQTRKLGSKTLVTEHRKKDGTIFPVEVTINYFHFNDKTMSFSFVKDITEQQKIQQQLAHTNELMRYIIEHANSAVAVFDCNMNYVFVSQRFIDEHQIADAEIIGKNHYEIFPNIPSKWKAIHQQALAGEVLRKNRDMIPKSDGSMIWTRWECRPWFKDAGVIGGIVLYTEEITARVKAEHAIRESEQKYRSLAENISEAIWTTDVHFNTNYISPAIEKIIGISPAKYMHLKLDERFPPSSVKILEEMISSELKNDQIPDIDKNRSLRFQLEHYHHKGGTLWISMNIAFIRDENGTITGFHGITHDITAQKKAELALRKLKGQLEEQVAEKTKELNERIRELQRFHDATIDREFRIKALRDEIKQLKGGKS